MPITFEGQCHSCHDLKFDADLPWREVPHGDDAGVEHAVRISMRTWRCKAACRIPMRRPWCAARSDTPLPSRPTESERSDALAWAAQRANAAMGIIFDDKRGCAYCHVTDRAGGAFTVAPVFMRSALPAASAVRSCQAHGDRTATIAMTPAIPKRAATCCIPGIETCVTCHGGERAELKTQSTCTSCHLFHRQEFGPMRQQRGGK